MKSCIPSNTKPQINFIENTFYLRVLVIVPIMPKTASMDSKTLEKSLIKLSKP